MKHKAKLFVTIASMCMVLCLAVVGILAVKTLNMSVGGNITFNAEGLNFMVSDGTFETTAGAAYPGVNSDSSKLKGFTMNTDTPESEIADEKASWTGLNLTMSSLGDVVLVFTVTNNMTENLVVEITPTITGTNINSNMEIQATGGTVVKGTPSKMKITFHIKDTSINAGLTGTNFTGFSVAVNFATEGATPGASANNPIDSTELPKLTFTPLTETTASVSDNGTTGELVIPAYVKIRGTTYAVTEIADNAFANNTAITSVKLPKTLVTIGNSAFERCYALAGQLIIPNSVVSIGADCFWQTAVSGELVIPDSVRTIGPSAFEDCHELTGLVLGKNVQFIGEMAFYGCYNIVGELIIPDSVVTIQDVAFCACEGFTSLVIGFGVTEIGASAFYECTSLESVTINALTPPVLGDNIGVVFGNTNNCPIYVPAVSIEIYKAASSWSGYVDRVEPIA